MKILAAALTIFVLGSLSSSAASPSAFALIYSCKGVDADMEVYAPSDLVYSQGGLAKTLRRKGSASGYYILDLSGAGKGKPLELVRLSARDGGIEVTQVTRPGLKPTLIPLQGGVVDFDQRFGTRADCKPMEAL